MVMHASLRTNDDHEDHMESTRDETPSLQLSMANWHAGVRLLLLILRVVPALSALSCVVCTIEYVVLASASLRSLRSSSRLAHATSAYLGSL